MRLNSIIELVLLAALWGASFMFMRIATPEFGAVALIETRVLLAGLVLLPVWYWRSPIAERNLITQDWRPLMTVGLLNSALPFVLFAYSTLYITGGFAAMLNASAPIWGALVAWIWLSQRLPNSGLFGLFIGFVGVLVLLAGSVDWSNDNMLLGASAALFAPFFYGVAANFSAQKLAHVRPLTIATFSQLGAALILLPLVPFFLPKEPISVVAWASVVALAVFCTSLAYLLYFRLIANIGSTRAITVTFLLPIFGSAWGAVFLDEIVTTRMILGAGVILFGTAMVVGLLTWPTTKLKGAD